MSVQDKAVSAHKHSEKIKFALVGGMGAIVYYIVLLSSGIILGKKRYVISVALALIANSAFNFLMQKYWAFKSASKPQLFQGIGPYVFATSIIVALNCFLVWAIVESTGWHPVLASSIAAIVLIPPSYKITRKILVKPSKTPDHIM